jgi:hypothetical protein
MEGNMPNWVDTVIKATPETIAAIKERFSSKGKYGDFLDFEKAIPMPPDIVRGDIPSWHPAVTEPATDVQRAATSTIRKLYGLAENALAKGDDPQAHLQAVLKVASQHGFDLDAIGCPVRTWYDWCPDNWGTKWNSSECSFSRDTISFQTAWSCPKPILEEISRQLGPDAVLVVKYADEDMGYNCGQYVLQDGKVTTEVAMEFGSRDAIKFACDVTGRDFEEYEDEMSDDEQEGLEP